MIYDIAIIGGGPAGLTASVYARRAGKSVVVIERDTFGGQITFSPKVENIPGFTSISGNEFAEKLVDQALAQGVDFESADVLSIEDGEVKTVVTDGGNISARTVIIATGAKHRLLGVENEENLIGNGISFCAVCDGAFYEGKHVGVVGGGNSALQEALMLSEICEKVTVIQNLDFLTGEKSLQEQLEGKDNVEIILGVTVDAFIGEDELKGVVIKYGEGNKAAIELDGLFIAIGLIPQNDRFAELLDLDSRGYATSGEDCLTGKNGIYVAGDCRTKKIRQVTTAASDGAIAALAACDYLDKE